MGLIEYQTALARLYTDNTLRERFRGDPAAVGPELNLTAEETLLAASLPENQVRCFAVSLVNKRCREVEKLLPLTSLALCECFFSLFSRYACCPIPEGVHKHFGDAVAFASFLQAREEVDLWVRDLARYESARLEVAMPGNSPSRVLLRSFRYSVSHAARLFRESASLNGLPKRWTLGVWIRLRQGRTRHWLLTP
jgi:hypothetical protein